MKIRSQKRQLLSARLTAVGLTSVGLTSVRLTSVRLTSVRLTAMVAVLLGILGAGDDAFGFQVPAVNATASAEPGLIVKKNTPLSALPFWKNKPALIEKIRNERAIIVSVKREDAPHDQVRFLMTGAGAVRRPKDTCFRIAQQYSKLKEISDHFKIVTFDSSSRQLFLVTEALGYQAQMILRISPVTEDWRSELQWEVVWGHFKGMAGIVGFEKNEDGTTEMSINAQYEASELPLPRVLMGFALEVVVQKVAEKMRTFIESQSDDKVSSSPLISLLGASIF